jgi:hypothetical protein
MGTQNERITPEEKPLLGYGNVGEVSPELANVMRQNSLALDEMTATRTMACSGSPSPTED